MSEELLRVKKSLEKEKKLRKKAEKLLEKKTSETLQVNQELQQNNKKMEQLFEELEVEKAKQLEHAYTSGIAENAISVLHNIGNAVTPAFVNIHKLIEEEKKFAIPKYLHKFLGSLKTHLEEGNLNLFLQENHKGKHMLPFLEQLIQELEQHHDKEMVIFESLLNRLEHIAEIISIQQKYANFQGMTQTLSVSDLIADVVRLIEPSLEKRKIALSIHVEKDLPEITTDKNKLVQIILNLFKNAIESIDEQLQNTPEMPAQIKFEVVSGRNYYHFTISDNGRGAPVEILDKVFNFGFTTKERGAGFGLHDCANFIQSQKGEIELFSDGPGQGATLKFTLPC
ncbi:MAG: hypothetical protein HQM13_16795 [SAR324 cluster bacterium]|nr:hypothetical protein [SAR324 cluster bacterium]